MESTASVKHLRSTARKARLVADAIRGKMVGEALALLEFGIQREVAGDIAKVVKSAVANMQSKHTDAAIDIDGLKIKEIKVDGGPIMKRFHARARGSASSIYKRMCHISVTVSN